MYWKDLPVAYVVRAWVKASIFPPPSTNAQLAQGIVLRRSQATKIADSIQMIQNLQISEDHKRHVVAALQHNKASLDQESASMSGLNFLACSYHGVLYYY